MPRSGGRIVLAERETAAVPALPASDSRALISLLARCPARGASSAEPLSMDNRQRLAELSSAAWTAMVAAKGPAGGVSA